MEGLITEGDEEEEPSVSLDAALIGAAQKTEHYEIAAYGTLATYAVELLETTLAEEKETDEKLAAIASELNLEVAESK